MLVCNTTIKGVFDDVYHSFSGEQASALQAQAAMGGVSVEAWLHQLALTYALQPWLSSLEDVDERPISEVIAENMRDVPLSEFERLPKDGASEHDHYLYGSPKRYQ